MTATVLDGRAIGKQIRDRVRKEVASLLERDFPPNLVSLQVGEGEPSRAYLKSQKRACVEAGILYTHTTLDEQVAERHFVAHVEGLCRNAEVTGLIIQFPVPARLDLEAAYRRMDPEKDVEGMHPANLGALFAGRGGLVPCTALAVREMVRTAGMEVRGREVVVIGHSQIVGKPIAMLFLNEDATVTSCHAATVDLARHARRADVLVVAAGRPGLIGADMVKPGAVVVDVGMNYLEGRGRPVGDVRFDEVAAVAGAITPVPGGVGPVTVAMLLANTVAAARMQAKRRGIEL